MTAVSERVPQTSVQPDCFITPIVEFILCSRLPNPVEILRDAYIDVEAGELLQHAPMGNTLKNKSIHLRRDDMRGQFRREIASYSECFYNRQWALPSSVPGNYQRHEAITNGVHY